MSLYINKRSKSFAYYFKSTSIFIFVLLLAACTSSKQGKVAFDNYNKNPYIVPIPVGLSEQQINNAMYDTLVAKRWEIKSRTDNEVVGMLNRRGYEAVVTLKSDGRGITILNDSSYVTKAEGREPAIPLGWITNIKRYLEKNLYNQFRLNSQS